MTKTKPVVFKKDARKRYGKGFSRDELKKAGLNIKEAIKHSILIDPRRKTVHKENITTLRKLLKDKGKKLKS
ncbi:MAG: ribosomal protein L13e [Candidatus Bathyarchaeota archaeon]|jgi:large subunit ribosomal protein L13e